MKATDIDIIRHSLGLDSGKKAYRNYFCAGPGHEDYSTLEKLVSEGKMVRRDYPLNEIDISYVYQVTPEGKKIAGVK